MCLCVCERKSLTVFLLAAATTLTVFFFFFFQNSLLIYILRSLIGRVRLCLALRCSNETCVLVSRALGSLSGLIQLANLRVIGRKGEGDRRLRGPCSAVAFCSFSAKTRPAKACHHTNRNANIHVPAFASGRATVEVRGGVGVRRERIPFCLLLLEWRWIFFFFRLFVFTHASGCQLSDFRPQGLILGRICIVQSQPPVVVLLAEVRVSQDQQYYIIMKSPSPTSPSRFTFCGFEMYGYFNKTRKILIFGKQAFEITMFP